MIKEIRAKGYGCLNLWWSLNHKQDWMSDNKMNLELRVKTADSSQWISKPVSTVHYKIN